MRNIVHIGVGNFHRSHQAEYFHQLNQLPGEDWGIWGISLMPQDDPLLQALKAQDYNYHLLKRSPNGAETLTRIDVIQDIIPAYQQAQQAVDRMADETTEIISFTITEGAYLYDQKRQRLDWGNAALQADRNSPGRCQTVFGYLYRALNQRRNSHGAGLTLMSCDNVPANSVVLKSALLEFVQAIDPSLALWIDANICFPSTMVDRITPAATDLDRAYIKQKWGVVDSAPVVSEEFRQWVIEDEFCHTRPDLQSVGAIYAADVEPFEDLKIKLLNGGHSCLAYLSYLMGYEYVHEAIQDEKISSFVEAYMRQDVFPGLQATPGVDISRYIDSLLERFSNAALQDKVRRLCADGLSKLTNFITPVYLNSQACGRSVERIAIIYAAYYVYLQQAFREPGRELVEPHSSQAGLLALLESLPLFLERLGIDDAGGDLSSLVGHYIDGIDTSIQPLFLQRVGMA